MKAINFGRIGLAITCLIIAFWQQSTGTRWEGYFLLFVIAGANLYFAWRDRHAK